MEPPFPGMAPYLDLPRRRPDVQVDYRADTPLPDLSPDAAAWLDAYLRERGLWG